MLYFLEMSLEQIPYSLLLTAHITTFMANILLVIIADVHGFLWVLGKKETLPRTLMHWLHHLLTLGLTISILTGAYLFFANLDYFSAVIVPAFYVKVCLVMMLVINAFVISKHMDVATERPFKSLTKAEKIPLFISGAVSTIGWVGVFTLAQFIGLS